MIVWRVIGNEIGPEGNGAAYFAKKSDAERCLREHRKEEPNRMRIEKVEKIEIKTREQLAAALNKAMGFGAS